MSHSSRRAPKHAAHVIAATGIAIIGALLSGANSGRPAGVTAGSTETSHAVVDLAGARHTLVLEDGVVDDIEVRFLRWDKRVGNRIESLGRFELLPASYLLPEPLADRDGDGVLEVAVIDADIGNSVRVTRLRLLSPTPTRIVDLLDAPYFDDSHWPVDLIDVDGDQVKEVVTFDVTLEWGLDGLAHALSPMVRSVFRFRPSGLVEDPMAPILVADLEEQRAALASARAEGDIHAILSHAAAVLLVDRHRGETEAGVRFEKATRGLRLSPQLTSDIAQVRRDLLRTPHTAYPTR